MPKQKGPIKIEGFLNGKVYYKMGDEWYVRNSSAPSKTKIKKKAAFKNFYASSLNFGNASAAASQLRKSLGVLLEGVSDSAVQGRLAGALARVIKAGQGPAGKRSLELLPNRHFLQGFEFKEHKPFDGELKGGCTLETTRNRKEVRLHIPSLQGCMNSAKEGGASHFRIILALICFSDFAWDEEMQAYQPLHPKLHQQVEMVYSGLVEAKGRDSELVISAKLPVKQKLPATASVVACTAIEYYQMTAGVTSLLKMNSCMKIQDVF